MRPLVLLVLVLAQIPYLRQAGELGRTRDETLYSSFSRGYELGPADTIDRAEVITEFRRAVMIVREHAQLGQYGYTEFELGQAMTPYQGQIAFTVQARLHPLHVYSAVPAYDLYVETGRSVPNPSAARPSIRRAR